MKDKLSLGLVLYGKRAWKKVIAELMAELERLQKQYDVPGELCK